MQRTAVINQLQEMEKCYYKTRKTTGNNDSASNEIAC